jgi:hypothetical protein
MTIVSACLLIVLNLVLIFAYRSASSLIFWIRLPTLAVSIVLNILSLLGGVQALVRTRFVFAIFGTSILIPPSLSELTYLLALLARVVTGAESPTISFYDVFFIAISPVVLVLSVLSLIFLARSRHEFS